MQEKQIIETLNLLKRQVEQYHEIEHAKSRSVDAPKQPKIPAWVGWLIPIVFGGIKAGVEQINDDLAKDFALFGLDNTAEIIGLLTDSDRNNLAQIGKWFADNWERLAKGGGALVLRLLEKHAPKNAKWGVIIEYLGKVLKEMEL